MGKISPVSIKYIIHANISLSGVADKPDIIGAIFGQTEGLLGEELELRELQKSGRIGRIEVRLETKGGKTSGEILLPSSMGKAETAIVAAALETIERVGPCDAQIKVTKIEDVRVSKRTYIVERAKELLKQLIGELPDSSALTSELMQDVRALEITEYGVDRLPAGPFIDQSDEIIIVEGRADVINLLKHGIRNVIGLKGAKASNTIIELSKKKITTLFVDGDRGGDLIIKNLLDVADIDYIARAPDGKEVEELTLKEIYKALRSKIATSQTKTNGIKQPSQSIQKQHDIATEARKIAEDLLGTRGAVMLDSNLEIIGKIPAKELEDVLLDVNDVYGIVMDGAPSQRLVKLAEEKGIKFITCTKKGARGRKTRVFVLNF